MINHKRTEMVYHEEGLAQRRKRGRNDAAGNPTITLAPERPSQKWSIDFVTDSIVSGRRFRALAIVDDYSRECPAIEVDASLGGTRVVSVLERLAETRGLPEIYYCGQWGRWLGGCWQSSTLTGLSNGYRA